MTNTPTRPARKATVMAAMSAPWMSRIVLMTSWLPGRSTVRGRRSVAAIARVMKKNGSPISNTTSSGRLACSRNPSRVAVATRLTRASWRRAPARCPPTRSRWRDAQPTSTEISGGGPPLVSRMIAAARHPHRHTRQSPPSRLWTTECALVLTPEKRVRQSGASAEFPGANGDLQSVRQLVVTSADRS